MQILPLYAANEPLVWEFLALASHDSPENVRTNPLLARYAEGWMREGDFGLQAMLLRNEKREAAGLIWSRLYSPDAPGFGFVMPDVPELSLAVKEDERSKGIGHDLIDRYIWSAKHRFPAVSLNVRETNISALRLYERTGFRKIESSERINRTGGISFNMILWF